MELHPILLGPSSDVVLLLSEAQRLNQTFELSSASN